MAEEVEDPEVYFETLEKLKEADPDDPKAFLATTWPLEPSLRFRQGSHQRRCGCLLQHLLHEQCCRHSASGPFKLLNLRSVSRERWSTATHAVVGRVWKLESIRVLKCWHAASARFTRTGPSRTAAIRKSMLANIGSPSTLSLK